MEDPVRPPKGFVAGNDRLDRMLAKRPVDRAAVDAEKERLLARTEGTQRYIDSGEYEGEYDAER